MLSARELSHVGHRDILVSTISVIMVGAISALANFALFFALFSGRRDAQSRPANPLGSRRQTAGRHRHQSPRRFTRNAALSSSPSR